MGWHSAHLIGFLVFWFIGVASSLASQGFDGPRAIINQKTKKPTLSGVLGFGPGEGGGMGGRAFCTFDWFSGFLVYWYGQLPGLPRL